ncbi:MAG: CBS domain-containing protein, partial [Candidatus Hodarchaeales archaeon]
KTIAVNSPLLHQDTKDFVAIAKKMIASDLSLLPVVDKYEKVLGIVSIRALTKLLLETSPIQEAGVEEYILDIPESEIVSINDSVEKTISMMKRNNTTDLAVEDNGKSIGIIRAKEVFGEWNRRERVTGGHSIAGGGEKKAVEATIETLIMDPVVLPLDGTKLVKDALDIMYKNNIGTVILQDAAGKSVGKLTMRNLLQKIIESEETAISSSDLVRIDGAPDDEIALICVKKAASLFDKYNSAFGNPREAVVSLKKIQYQSKRGMFLWEVGIKMDFDKKAFHVSATDFGTRKTANVAFVKLGRILRDYRGRLYDRYQIGTKEPSPGIPPIVGGSPSTNIRGSPTIELEAAVRKRVSSFFTTSTSNLVINELENAVIEFNKLESTPEPEGLAWSCMIEFNFATISFTQNVMADKPEVAFETAFNSIVKEITVHK